MVKRRRIIGCSTREVANELWIAREVLKAQGKRTDLTSEQKFKSWGDYCRDIGVSQQVVNRWLNQWFPESLTLENKPLVSISKRWVYCGHYMLPQ
jgi:hypothetical protein